jgi:hypothetical protein
MSVIVIRSDLPLFYSFVNNRKRILAMFVTTLYLAITDTQKRECLQYEGNNFSIGKLLKAYHSKLPKYVQ